MPVHYFLINNRPKHRKKSLLEFSKISLGNILEICSVEFVDTLKMMTFELTGVLFCFFSDSLSLLFSDFYFQF